MKKIFAIALAVVMVLSIASVASAYSWLKPAETTTDDTNFGYSIDVIKFTRSTAGLGSSYFNADDAATAVNGADVYYAIKLVVNNPSDAVKEVAKATINFTAIDGFGKEYTPVVPTENGVYYYAAPTWAYAQGNFELINYFVENNLGMSHTAETPVFAVRCLDTATAKVAAKVEAKRNLDNWFTVGEYSIKRDPATGNVKISPKANGYVAFHLNVDDQVTHYGYMNLTVDEVNDIFKFLDAGSIDQFVNAMNAGEVYMTDDNLRAAFGFSYSTSDSITWNANSTPIILDPTVAIPKTGDNASVIGFAMIMVAVVAVAVAVRKVNA